MHIATENINYPFQFESNQKILRRDSRTARRDIIHMPATRLALVTPDAEAIWLFFRSLLSSEVDTPVRTPVCSFLFFCSPSWTGARARPEMTLRSARRIAPYILSPLHPRRTAQSLLSVYQKYYLFKLYYFSWDNKMLFPLLFYLYERI